MSPNANTVCEPTFTVLSRLNLKIRVFWEDFIVKTLTNDIMYWDFGKVDLIGT